MALGKIVSSDYGGFYYVYTFNGKENKLRIFTDIYYKYIKTKYITEDMLDEAIKGNEVPFDFNGKSVILYLKPHTTRRGKNTTIIDFKYGGNYDDKLTIFNNRNELIKSCIPSYTNPKIDFREPQQFIYNLKLIKNWKTYIDYRNTMSIQLQDDLYVFNYITVYTGTKSSKENIDFYFCFGTKDGSTFLKIFNDEDNYLENQKLIQKLKEDADKEANERLRVSLQQGKELYETEIINWETDLMATLMNNANIFDALKELTKDIPDGEMPVSSSYSKFYTYTTYNKAGIQVEIINSVRNELNRKIYRGDGLSGATAMGNTINKIGIDKVKEEINNYHTAILQKLKVMTPIWEAMKIRAEIYDIYQKDGLKSITSPIKVENALDLGRIDELHKVLDRPEKFAVESIIFGRFTEIVDKDKLKETILYSLKVYDAFHNMAENDRKSVAKFVAEHNMKAYYDTVKKYDDVLEVLISNSNDAKFKKDLLINKVVGTHYANDYVNSDSSFYFERKAKIKSDTLLYKPVELVEDLRKNYLKQFNESSDMSILMNIILEDEDTLVFQFYSIGTTGEDESFDGRRLKYLTQLYNNGKPKENRLYLTYNCTDIDEEE